MDKTAAIFLGIMFVLFFSFFILISFMNIKKRIILSLISKLVIYSISTFIFTFTLFYYLNRMIVDYSDCTNSNEVIRKMSSGYWDLLMSFNSFFLFILFDHRWLFLFTFTFLFMWIYIYKNNISFICPHCLKTIFFKKISSIPCSLCNTDGHSRFELFLYCSSCYESMDYFDCPHCQHPINIKEKYDHEALLYKRREVSKLRPLYLTGLRELYNRKKRLPQFICKHCLKTLIAKNYNLTCPHCKAVYCVTDNRTQVQVGDVKIKNYRFVGDESTMEKILFDSCIQCGGMIEVVECYHDDCKKDIDLREEYNEIELLKRRYEQEKS